VLKTTLRFLKPVFCSVAPQHPTSANNANLTLPDDWQSGLYIARISATDGTTNDTKDIPFVVKAPSGRQGKILCVVPFATIQAYNRWGGRGLYGHAVDNATAGAFQWGTPRAFKVSFDRPMLYPDDNPGNSDVEYRWVPFIKWFEKNGFPIDYCTSVDLHANSALLNAYNLVLSIGHDEYWSKEMRDNMEAFAAQGGNVAFFSGNTCWWQVRFEDDNHTMVCYKDASLDPLSSTDPIRTTVNWYDYPVELPENSMTGVSWRYGAVRPANFNEPRSFLVRDASHWVFAGTGLNDGDQFGTEVFLFSETDACLYNDTGARPMPTGQDGTPLDFAILATADLTGWVSYLGGIPRATMGVHGRAGTIFTAATNDWGQGLTFDGAPTVIDMITANVLTRLSTGRVSLAPRGAADWIETVGRRGVTVSTAVNSSSMK
jgi:hypothetical protein